MPSSEDIQKLNTFRFYKSIIIFNLGKYSPTAGNTEHSLCLLILLLYKIKPCAWDHKNFLVKFWKLRPCLMSLSLLQDKHKQTSHPTSCHFGHIRKTCTNRRSHPCLGTHWYTTLGVLLTKL